MRDHFFDAKVCDRCGKPLTVRIMSMDIRNIHGIVCTVGGRYGYRPQGNGNAFNKVE